MRQNFKLQKITVTLNLLSFLFYLQMSSFYFKEQLPKKKFKIKKFYTVFRPLNWAKLFLTWTKEQKLKLTLAFKKHPSGFTL